METASKLKKKQLSTKKPSGSKRKDCTKLFNEWIAPNRKLHIPGVNNNSKKANASLTQVS